MGGWKKMRSWINWYLQLIFLSLGIILLISCSTKHSSSLSKQKSDESKSTVTINHIVGININN